MKNLMIITALIFSTSSFAGLGENHTEKICTKSKHHSKSSVLNSKDSSTSKEKGSKESTGTGV